MSQNKNLVVIIPAYNEAGVIGDVIKKVQNLKVDYIDQIKCLVIDDGSTDNTAEIAKNLGVEVIRHNKNKGVGIALATGINFALAKNFDLLVNIDADSQFNPEEIESLIQPILNNQADFVASNRFQNGRPNNMPLTKYWGNGVMTKLVNYLTKEKFQDVSCGFRAYNKEALLNLNLFGKYTYTQETFLDLAFKNLRIKQIPVNVEYFQDRESKVAGNLFKYTWKTLNIIIRSIIYYKPLRFFGYPGITLLLIGFAFIGVLIWFRVSTGGYTPYKAYGFIGGGLSLFGLLMIFIGLLSDILDKIRRTQDKILYYEKRRNYCKKR